MRSGAHPLAASARSGDFDFRALMSSELRRMVFAGVGTQHHAAALFPSRSIQSRMKFGHDTIPN